MDTAQKKRREHKHIIILIPDFFEVLHVSKFQKVLGSRAVLLVKMEIQVQEVWAVSDSALAASSHDSVLVWGYTWNSKFPAVLKFSLDIRLPWRHL